MLELELSYRRGDFTLELELAVAERVCAVCGPSGSGKTSLLDLVAGLRRPDRGFIRLDGELLFDAAAGVDLHPERRRLGYLFQDGALFPHLDVRGNLRYGLRRRGGQDPGFDEVVAVLGLGDLLRRETAKLSGGEKQRVALGRALLSAPRLLLLDEPLASLDGELKARILPFLSRTVEAFDLPMLYVSHSSTELRSLAERMVLLEKGRIYGEGAPASLFGASDPENRLSCY